MKKRFAAAAGSGSGFRRSLGALALMLSCGVFAAFSALPVPALAGPPPGMHHPGPGFGGPGHRPGFRPGPPPPPPRYHRGWHPRPWYRSWGIGRCRIRQLSVVLVLERTRILPDRSLLPTRLGDRDGHEQHNASRAARSLNGKCPPEITQ